MMENKRRSAAQAAQYEPLVTPQKWQGDERRFAFRLTQLMDQLFQRQATMFARIAALEKQMEKENTNG